MHPNNSLPKLAAFHLDIFYYLLYLKPHLENYIFVGNYRPVILPASTNILSTEYFSNPSGIHCLVLVEVSGRCTLITHSPICFQANRVFFASVYFTQFCCDILSGNYCLIIEEVNGRCTLITHSPNWLPSIRGFFYTIYLGWHFYYNLKLATWYNI